MGDNFCCDKCKKPISENNYFEVALTRNSGRSRSGCNVDRNHFHAELCKACFGQYLKAVKAV